MSNSDDGTVHSDGSLAEQNTLVCRGEDLSCVQQCDSLLLSNDAARTFPIGATFSSAEELKKTLITFGSIWGFHIKKNGTRFECNRAGVSHSLKLKTGRSLVPPEKQRNRIAALKCGCTFYIGFKLHKPASQTNEAAASGLQDVVISTGCYSHSIECVPSLSNLIYTRKNSGFYAQLNQEVMEFITILCRDDRMCCKQLRAIVSLCLPKTVPLSSKFLINVLVRARSLVPYLDRSGRLPNSKIKSFEFEFIGLESQCEQYYDLATVAASELLADHLMDQSVPQSIEQYFVTLNRVDHDFLYNVLYDSNHHPIGYCWQSPVMRAAFEIHGDCLFVDVMHRNMNKLRWPYMSICVLDGYRHVQVVIEAIVHGETMDCYSWLINQVCRMTPKRCATAITIIYSDQFLQESIRTTTNLNDSVHLVWDQWHLLESTLPRRFGSMVYSNIKAYCSSMANAPSAFHWETAYASALTIVGNNQIHVKVMEELRDNKHKYAKYIIHGYEGGLQRLGNVTSEQNHSSFLARISPMICEDTESAICQIIGRQQLIGAECNSNNTEYIFRAKAIKRILSNKTQQTVTEMMQISCLEHLSSWGYDLFMEQFSDSMCYDMTVDPNEPNVVSFLRRQKDETSRRFLCIGDRCNCYTRISYNIQCRHEILYYGVFRLDLFSCKWHIRSILPKSTTVFEDNTVVSTLNIAGGSDEAVPFTPDGIETDDTLQGYSPTTTAMRDSSTNGNGTISNWQSENHNFNTSTSRYHTMMAELQKLATLSSTDYSTACIVMGMIIDITDVITKNKLVCNEPDPQKRFEIRRNDSFISYLSKVDYLVESFKPTTVTNNTDITVINDNYHHSQPLQLNPCLSNKRGGSKRKKSSHENQLQKKVTWNSSSKTSPKSTAHMPTDVGCRQKQRCSFCHSQNHNNSKTSSCPTLLTYGVMFTKDVNEITSIADSMSLRSPPQGTNPAILEKLSKDISRHVILHEFVLTASYPRCAIVTCLDNIPNEIEGYVRRITPIPTLLEWVSAQSRNNKRMLIDGRSVS